MKFETFVSQPDVMQFASWLSERLGRRELSHGYYDRSRRRQMSFAGLNDALAQYVWNGRSYPETEQYLQKCADRLGTALAGSDDHGLKCAAIEVLSWGRVLHGNEKWIRNATDLRAALRSGCQILSGDDVCAKNIKRFNAGMSKIYSLLLPKFVIYDSRVAAALAWFVKGWCEQTARSSVPDVLAFRCMEGKESPRSKHPKLRNPSSGQYLFPRANTDWQRALWNMRASWLIRHALEVNKQSVFHQQRSPERALEAALFMWGYDMELSTA